MKKPNTVIELLKLFAMMVIGWFFWLLIFSITITPEDAEMTVEPFRGASLLFGLLTGLIISAGLKYNAMHRAYQRTKSAYSNISIFNERAEKLLDKANRVADKYMDFEGSVQISIAHERNERDIIKGKIYNSHQFKTALENYPDLKANESIMELLKQIQDCENGLANQKLIYNNEVEKYNTLIHSFPASVLCGIFRFKDAEFYSGTNETEIVSDEQLGI